MSIEALRRAVLALEPGEDRTPAAKLHRLGAGLRTIGHPWADEAAAVLAGVAGVAEACDFVEPPKCERCGRYVKTGPSALQVVHDAREHQSEGESDRMLERIGERTLLALAIIAIAVALGWRAEFIETWPVLWRP